MWDTENGVCYLSLLRIHKTDHSGKGFQGCKPMIACIRHIFALFFEFIKEWDNKPRCEMFYSEGSYFNAIMFCSKGKNQFEGIPIGYDRIVTHPLDVGKILIKKLTDARGKLHGILSCQRVKSTRFFLLMASTTRRYMAVYQ